MNGGEGGIATISETEHIASPFKMLYLPKTWGGGGEGVEIAIPFLARKFYILYM